MAISRRGVKACLSIHKLLAVRGDAQGHITGRGARRCPANDHFACDCNRLHWGTVRAPSATRFGARGRFRVEVVETETAERDDGPPRDRPPSHRKEINEQAGLLIIANKLLQSIGHSRRHTVRRAKDVCCTMLGAAR